MATYKTTGTLKEIGAKVGDVVESEPGFRTELCQRHLDSFMRNVYTIISRAEPAGPVRTVTRKEIVPGVYGKVKVHDPGAQFVRIVVNAAMSRDELTAAIATLTEIRDAL